MSLLTPSLTHKDDGAATPSGVIRVLICDDSAFMRTALTRMIESDASLKVVGAAQDGVRALQMAAELQPDVITLDVEMPRMDGLETLRRLMEENPRPVLMVSSLTQAGAEATLEAFDLGAVDCLPKQLSYASLDIVKIRGQLIEKIKAAAGSKVRRGKRADPQPPAAHKFEAIRGVPAPSVIAIGTSTGGPGALRQVIPALPADLPVGVLVVQHMPPGFTGPLAKRLDSVSNVRVSEATDEHPVEPGEVLIAPAGFQMTAYRRGPGRYSVRVGSTPSDTLHMPSVDVMMLSVAEAYGALAMGVILTGMGNDGLRGMAAIHEKGGMTLGQDQASCVVYGMPRVCAERNVLRRVAPLGQIADEMVSATRATPRR
jgi:two-component system chemotaxis response regulator CheB